MKKSYLTFFSIIAVFIFLLSCSSVRNIAPSAIGLLPLEGYQPVPATQTADTVYGVFRNEEAFNQNFTASFKGTRRPAFEGQAVVAMKLIRHRQYRYGLNRLKWQVQPFVFLQKPVPGPTVSAARLFWQPSPRWAAPGKSGFL